MTKFVFRYDNGKYAKNHQDADSVLDARVYETIDPHRAGGQYLLLIPTLSRELEETQERATKLSQRLQAECLFELNHVEGLVQTLEAAERDLVAVSESLRAKGLINEAEATERDAKAAGAGAKNAREILERRQENDRVVHEILLQAGRA